MQPKPNKAADRLPHRFIFLLSLLGLFALAISNPAAAREPGAAPYLELQQRDQQVFGIGWRLVTGNAPFCARTAPAIGAMLHDAAAYPDPAAARAALAMGGDIAVQAVAEGSPAALYRLPVGATLTRVAERDLAASFPRSTPVWRRLAEIEALQASALARTGAVAMVWREPNDQSVVALVPGVAACITRFEVSGIGTRAVADGERVVIGDRFPGFGYPEEEFAAAIAHELAHNVLGHRAWLDRNGRSRNHVRATEEEADRLAPWLLANAGYDPAAAVRFMQRWGPRHDGGLLRKRTHAGWDERAAAIAAELPAIEAARNRSGTADWSRGFRRQIGG